METENGDLSAIILELCQKLKSDQFVNLQTHQESHNQGKKSKRKIFFPRDETVDFDPIQHLLAVLRLSQTTQSKEKLRTAEDQNYISEFDVIQASTNRIKLGFGSSNNQDKIRPFTDALLKLPHRGLKIDITTPFLEAVNKELIPQKVPNLAAEPQPQERIKFKTSKSSVLMLRIGSWKTVRQKSLDDIVAKCYYGKRQLVWEFLENRLKKKIQIPWEHILAMKATTEENKDGVLEIELSNPPSFFWETEPMPRKHTVWKKATDFTDDQATVCRRHYLQFPEGTLEKYYAALLRVPEFLRMSQSPFQSLQSPHFPSDIHNAGEDVSVSRKGNASQMTSVQPPSYSEDFQNKSTDYVSFGCTGIGREFNSVQQQPNSENVDHVGTDFSLVSSENGPQYYNNFQQLPNSSVPVNQAFWCQNPVLCNNFPPTSGCDGMNLDAFMGSVGVENTSNMALWDLPRSAYAGLARRRDMMALEHYSTALTVAPQGHSIFPYQDYNMQPAFNEGHQNPVFQLPMNENENGFSSYSGLSNENTVSNASNMMEGLFHGLPFTCNEGGFQNQLSEVPVNGNRCFSNLLGTAEDSNPMIDPFMIDTNHGGEWIGNGEIGGQSNMQPVSWWNMPEDNLVNMSSDPNETMTDFTGIQGR